MRLSGLADVDTIRTFRLQAGYISL